ncbi:MAG: hypothetical protein NWT02_04310 [Opitutales bacterium]|jgi:hypothetical protein|nr:hypothetical protein [Opitutales bacterium]MDP4644654.1 hypothetical protein [Opitutales bacterium]MDP4776976.1 hypothetical protein [Opitutales bacterium]MDP4883073.1 hypothetical protein [Opitutales bacterium]
MQKELSENYRATAKRCEARLAPVGDAWSQVRKDHPELGKQLYRNDGSHPSAKGVYLAACVFYVSIFEKSPEKIEFDRGVSEDEKQVILKALRDR